MKTSWRSKGVRWDWWFVGYLILALGIRFWNFREAAYFIYDVGRDLIVLREMSLGDLKLIGQTTGLPGLFYGPLWYYVGLMGYVLASGNPYGVQVWYIAIACLSIPLYWFLAKRLFGENTWAKIAALLLAFIPGGVTGTNFVWNVMLSVPLMTGALYGLTKARESKKWLYLGFFCLALTLQAEFAYAVFFVTILWLLIPWMRGRFEIKTSLVALAIIFITLLPQIGFELTHHFSMTKAIFSGLNQEGTTVDWSFLRKNRPQQMWNTTEAFFIKNDSYKSIIIMGLAFFGVVGIYTVFRKKEYKWQIVLLMAGLPYVCYLFWRGNYGYFFEYYLTPHFIFLVLIITLGMQHIVFWTKKHKISILGWMMVLIFTTLLVWQGYRHIRGIIIAPINNAGLRVMETAVKTLFDWTSLDQNTKPVFRIYTPNLSTENYDYLVWWQAREQQRSVPITTQNDQDKVRYILYEPDEHIRELRFLPWYKDATLGFEKSRAEKLGILTLETWVRPNNK